MSTTDKEKIKHIAQYCFNMQTYLKNEIISYENAVRFSSYPQDILELYRRKCNYEFYKRMSSDIEKILFDF